MAVVERLCRGGLTRHECPRRTWPRWLEPPFPPNFGGAFLEAWAQRVPCSAARKIAMGWNGKRSYRGYGCIITKRAYEFLAVRCTRRGGDVVRWETGA
jgi:hypothetical protein